MECFEGLSALILKALTNKQEKVAYLKKKKKFFELFEVLLSDFQTLWREAVKQSIPNFGSTMSTNHFLDLL